MPLRTTFCNALSSDLFSMQIYKPDHFTHFNVCNSFEKWAALEVADFDHIPQCMEAFTLPGGLYAVFDYKGLSTDHAIFEYIFGTWLPNTDYLLDDRPHFEVLGKAYKNNDPSSEEEVWIPIKPPI